MFKVVFLNVQKLLLNQNQKVKMLYYLKYFEFSFNRPSEASNGPFSIYIRWFMATKTLSPVTLFVVLPKKNWMAYQTVCTAVATVFFWALINDLCFFGVIWWISRNNLAIIIHEKRYTFPTHWIFHYVKSKSGNNWCNLNPIKPLIHLQLNQLPLHEGCNQVINGI